MLLIEKNNKEHVFKKCKVCHFILKYCRTQVELKCPQLEALKTKPRESTLPFSKHLTTLAYSPTRVAQKDRRDGYPPKL